MSPRPHPCVTTGYAADVVGRVLDDALAHGSRIYAIGGVQGSGKSTLAAQVAALARTRGLAVATLSVDDFYLGRRERQRLARTTHPLLATRGPPGTHEVALACEVLDALRAGRPTRLPRFDKLADTRLPPSRWPHVRAVELVLFEGWFLKTPPQAGPALIEPINALERDEDGDGRWRHHCNEALGRDYPALWARLDRLLWLQAPGFEVVPAWRWQQEQSLQAAQPQRRAMTRPQLERFVQLFERVSRHSLECLPTLAERTLHLDAQRRPLALAPPCLSP
ncbi:kinase [Lysobacter cavernae]|uniref:Kinase n=1 Tax=Lysobacter cavernae TaxID=1685901 RepID=A0ABV7RN44_9GAMM